MYLIFGDFFQLKLSQRFLMSFKKQYFKFCYVFFFILAQLIVQLIRTFESMVAFYM